MLNTMPIAVKDQIGGLLKDFKFVKLTGDKILIIDLYPASREDHGHHHQARSRTIERARPSYDNSGFVNTRRVGGNFIASTLSTRRPSRSTTSKRQP